MNFIFHCVFDKNQYYTYFGFFSLLIRLYFFSSSIKLFFLITREKQDMNVAARLFQVYLSLRITTAVVIEENIHFKC